MKIKRIMAFFLMFTLSASALMAGCAKQEEQQTAETPSQSQQATQQAEQNEQAAEPVAGKNLAVVNGIAAVADDNGFSIIDEAAGKETQIDSEPANQVIFNGSTAYYVRRGIEDKSVKIRYDEDTIVDEGDEEVWLRGEVYIFTKESGKSQKLFITNQETAELVYFDSENLYYTDFADENVGYFLGASKDIARSLYKYDLNSGTFQVIYENQTLSDLISATDTFTLIFDREEMKKDSTDYFIQITATPTNTTAVSGTITQLQAQISVSKGKDYGSRWRAVLTEPDDADYDAYNVQVSGSGAGTIEIMWKTEYFNISDMFLMDTANTFRDSTGDAVTGDNAIITAGEWSKVILEVDSYTKENKYDIQFFKKHSHTFSASDPVSAYIKEGEYKEKQSGT